MASLALIVSCEHGGNRIPAPFGALFDAYAVVLDSHRGFDAGALTMARTFARRFGAPLVGATVSRLLIDLNRSLGHPRVFSEVTRALPARQRAQIVEQYYLPHRRRVEDLVRQALRQQGQVVHLASHSFCPELDGRVRTADVGLLYDPSRAGEAALCARWKDALAVLAPALRVRRNYPYAGKDDGLTAHLRKSFPASAYLGIELEFNQAIVAVGGRRWAALRAAVSAALALALAPTSGRT